MAVTAPIENRNAYQKQAEVTVLTASLAAQKLSPSTASTRALAEALYQKQTELVYTLMAEGHLSPATILSTLTYGT
jgi:hypothetical protein